MQPLSATDSAIGDLLVARKLITLAQLDDAVELAERWHVRLPDVLLSRDWLSAAVLYETLARHFDLPFVDLVAEPSEPGLLDSDSTEECARMLTVPWRQRDGQTLIATATPGPEMLLYARRRWGSNIQLVVATKFDIVTSLQSLFREKHSYSAVYELAETDPEMSAQQVFTPIQVVVAYGFLTLVALGLAFVPIATLIALNVVMAVFYLGNFVFKGILVWCGGQGQQASAEALDAAARLLRDEDLPIYTILVPMFREPEVLPILASALRKLDYPLAKLDIKIVLEEGDHETIEAARSLGLEAIFEIIRVPASQPQTKPKACNYALRFGRGELLVIYDAEDKPEPDQLRKVVAAFQRSPDNTACIQCRLNYYNASGELADPPLRARLFALVRPHAAGSGTAARADPARRDVEPISRSTCCANCTPGIPSTSRRTRTSAFA